MYSQDLIKQALTIQNENNNSIKTALNYSGCVQGVVNIVYYWFMKQDDDDAQRIKRALGFPSNESAFASTWWNTNFINNTLYRSRIKRYFESILQDKCQDGDDNSTLFYLGSNNICKDSVREPYIQTAVWRKVSGNLRKIIGALFAMNYGVKMEGDDTPIDTYIRLGISVSERPSSGESRPSPGGSTSTETSGRTTGDSGSSRDTRSKSVFDDLNWGGGRSSLLSDDSYLNWKEIPPKLDERFECESKEEINHSYTYIKEQVEKFIIETYFKRDDVYKRYDYALNVLMSRFKNGRFNFDEFWKLLGNKYKNNSEVRDILLTEIRIKCPTTASGTNLFVKVSNQNNEFSFSNNNSLNYEVIKTASKYNLNLPSRLIVAASTFRSPEDAACLLGFNVGDTIHNYDIALKLSEINRRYRDLLGDESSPHRDFCRAEYNTKFNAGNYLMNHITTSGRPFVLRTDCGSMLAVDDSRCMSPSASSSETIPTDTTPSPVPDTSPTPSPAPSPSPIEPSTPVPTGRRGDCLAKFYDLGFIDYCAIVIDPKELKEITEKLINTIQNLQYVELSKQARKADILPSILDKANNAADLGLQLATILYGKR